MTQITANRSEKNEKWIHVKIRGGVHQPAPPALENRALLREERADQSPVLRSGRKGGQLPTDVVDRTLTTSTRNSLIHWLLIG